MEINMNNIRFFEKDGKIHFSLPNHFEIEKRVRAIVKTKCAKPAQEFFFKRGIIDAVNSVVNNVPRKFGTPIVEVKDPFSGESQITTCQKAKELLEDIGGTYQIRQVGGNNLPKGYFENL